VSIFSSKLQYLREAAGESQDQVAEAIDVSRVAYTRYENGLREPKASIAIKLAQHFNTTVERLFSDDEEGVVALQLPDMNLNLTNHEYSIILKYRLVSRDTQIAVCNVLGIEAENLAKAN